MIDISIFDKIKHKPEEYNFLVTSFYKKEIVKYFETNKVPVLSTGFTDYIKMVYEKHPENPIQHISEFTVHDVSTHETVLFDYSEFMAGTQYLSGSSYAYRCDSCDDKLITLLYHDKIVLGHEEGNDCFEVKDYTVSFIVPENGKMVVSDWLGSILPNPKNPTSLNSERGKYNATKDAESNGFVHFNVGNSCPSLYQLPDGSIIVAGTSAVEPEDSEESPYPGAVKLCNVCTDLWWVTMASENHCLSLEKKGGKYIRGDVIDMEPGTWECTVHILNDEDTEPYATFKKVK